MSGNRGLSAGAVKDWILKELVLIIALVAAVITAFLVPPSPEYVSYIDWKVLSCLFCLMVVVAGLRKSGLFEAAAALMIRRAGSQRRLAAILIFASFFASMLITNDVALITLVPFTLLVLRTAPKPSDVMTILTLQTIAANIGSSLTPIGNPQNLYLFSFYEMSPSVFFASIAPVVLVGGVLLCFAVYSVPKVGKLDSTGFGNYRVNGRSVTVYAALFVMSILSVFRIIDYRIILAGLIIVVFLYDKSLFLKVDYSLLLTFVGFFVFIGNLQRLPAVRDLLTSLVQNRAFIVASLASQLISNVPAAILLSHFTSDAPDILRGVSVGGMGTIIASLASVISFKFYAKERNDGTALRYLLVFTVWNVLFFIILAGFCLIMW